MPRALLTPVDRPSGIIIYVDDLMKSCGFYEMLGFSWGRSGGSHAQFIVNDFVIEIIEARGELTEMLYDRAREKPRGNGIQVRLPVSDPVGLNARLNAIGARPGKIYHQPWGVIEFLIEDPDGYGFIFWAYSEAKGRLAAF